jgi:hypothetical protein
VTVDSPAMDSRHNSQTSLASHNKQTFQRLLGSFRSAVVSKDDMAGDGPSMYFRPSLKDAGLSFNRFQCHETVESSFL